MDLNEFLLANNVTIQGVSWDQTYKNLENVIGKQVWICDFRLNKDKDIKPIRKITPKLVQVFSNDDLPKGKNVYYSPVHFKEIKKGKVLSTVIAPYDNTGYRTYTGVSVNIFDTEKECVDFFRKQCDEVIKEYNEEMERRMAEIQRRILEIENLKK